MWWIPVRPKRLSIPTSVVHGARAATWIVIATVAWISLLPGAAMMPIGRGLTAHFVAYAVLGAIAGLGYGGSALRYGCLALVLVACAGLFEFSQIWAPGRTFSLLDLVASTAGGLVGMLGAWTFRSFAGPDR
jgi:VanZ like family